MSLARLRVIARTGAAFAAMMVFAGHARAQQIDLSHGGQITVTAVGGFDWDQKAQTVTAYGSAQAVRGGVTITSDRLIAYYRKKAGTASAVTPTAATTPAPQPTPENPTGMPATDAKAPGGTTIMPGGDTSATEIYRIVAIGHVHIFTATQQAFGDHGIYDIDQAVMVLTGHDLRLITPQDVLTARDQMEYGSQTRISVGRGNAVVTTNDGRRIQADVLVGYSAPPAAQPAGAKPADATAKPANSGQDPIGSSGKLEKVNAFGNVIVRTQTETVRGDRGVYVPDTGIARIVGNVHITRGQNQLNGAAAIVNMHTGIATLSEDPGARVQGLIVPNDTQGAPARTPGKAAATP
ncbi:MAG: LptA/OstA family protein [Janthinobacterium lividum]